MEDNATAENESVETPSSTEEIEKLEPEKKPEPATLRDKIEQAVKTKQAEFDQLEKPTELGDKTAKDDTEEAKETKEKIPTKDKEQKEKPLKAPSSWKEEDKKAWQALPDDLKRTVSQRERERDNKITELAVEKSRLEKEFTAIKEASERQISALREVEKAATTLKSLGVPGAPLEALAEAVKGVEYAKRDPLNFIKEFAQLHQIDLSAIVGGRDELAFDRELHQERFFRQQKEAELEAYKQALAEERNRQKLEAERQAQMVERRAIEKASEVVQNFLDKQDQAELEVLKETWVRYVDALATSNPELSQDTILEEALFLARLSPAGKEYSAKKATANRLQNGHQAALAAKNAASFNQNGGAPVENTGMLQGESQREFLTRLVISRTSE